MLKIIRGCSLILFLATQVQAQELLLTPESVAERVLKNSNQVEEVIANADLARLPYARALGAYDFNLTAESGYEISKADSVSASQYSDQEDSWKSTLSLSRAFSTGSLLSLDASRTLGDRYTQEQVGLTLTQNLWRNFFGRADRADLLSAQKTYQASRLTRATELQNLVLRSLRSFWDAAVAQETHLESLRSRERYEKLVAEVQRKARFGSASPGELPQVLAEFETRGQNIRSSEVELNAKMDSLRTLLRLAPEQKIQLKMPTEIPAPPGNSAKEANQTRNYQATVLKLEASEKAYEASLSRNQPDFSLVGRLMSTGYDQSSSEADQELLRGSKPKYYVGVKFQYRFGDLESEEILNRKLQLNLERARFDRQKRELQDQLQNAERKVQSLFEIAKSVQTQTELRERAARDLNRTYNQGRTDVSVFVDALNKSFATKIQLSRAIGDYQIALNEYAALRDELIRDPEQPSPEITPME